MSNDSEIHPIPVLRFLGTLAIIHAQISTGTELGNIDLQETVDIVDEAMVRSGLE